MARPKCDTPLVHIRLVYWYIRLLRILRPRKTTSVENTMPISIIQLLVPCYIRANSKQGSYLRNDTHHIINSSGFLEPPLKEVHIPNPYPEVLCLEKGEHYTTLNAHGGHFKSNRCTV